MRRYATPSGPALTINGKDYSLLRRHQDRYGKPFFVQVSGATPLRKEDLPTKEWALLSAKRGQARVDTAYFKPWFRYDVGRDFTTLAFLGSTQASALALVLRFLAQRAHLSLSVAELLSKAKEIAESELPSWLTASPNHGSAPSSAVLLDLSPWLEDEVVPGLLTGDAHHAPSPDTAAEER